MNTRIERLRARASEAIEDLYHNATPKWPDLQNDYEHEMFMEWLGDAGGFEIDYIQGGGATNFNPERGQEWELVSKYFGKLYQYGRGGRTVAPEKLMHRYGSSEGPDRDQFADCEDHRELIRAIRIIELFNKHVRAWNASVPEQWAEDKEANGWQADIDAHHGKRKRMRAVWE